MIIRQESFSATFLLTLGSVKCFYLPANTLLSTVLLVCLPQGRYLLLMFAFCVFKEELGDFEYNVFYALEDGRYDAERECCGSLDGQFKWSILRSFCKIKLR